MNARLASFWQRAAESAAALLLLAAPVAVLMKSYEPGALRSAVFELGALAALLVWTLKSLERGRFEAPSAASPWLAPAGALAAWALLRWGLEPHRAAALPSVLDALLSFGLFAVAGLELGGYRAVSRLSSWALCAAWAVVLAGTVQKLKLGAPLAAASFPDPKSLAVYLALCAPLIALKRLDLERDPWLKRLDLALLALACANVAWTGSSEGLAAFCVVALASAAALAGLVPSRAARREAMLLVTALMLTLLAAALLNAQAFGRDALYQLEVRRALWPAAWDAAWEKPLFGWGLAGFETELSRRPPLGLLAQMGAHGARLSAASEPLQLMGELGAAGLALALACALGLWRAVLRARRSFAQSAGASELTALACLGGAVFGLCAAALLGAASPRAVPWLLAPLAGALGGLTLLAPGSRVVRVIPLGLSPAAVKRAYAPAALLALLLAAAPAQWLSSDLSLNSGAALASSGRFEEAAASLSRVSPWSRSGPSALYFLGSALLEKGDPVGALAAYDRLDALSPDYAQSNYYAALANARAGRWEQALARASRQRDIDPTFASNEVLLADAALRTGDLALARRAALTAVSLEPFDPLRWSALSAIYAQERRAEDAARAQHRARRLKRGARRDRAG